jgi:hypothetical protein
MAFSIDAVAFGQEVAKQLACLVSHPGLLLD